MNQRDDKNLREKIIPADVYTTNFTDNVADNSFAKEREPISENDSTKKVEELLAPYYDEFHFANYE